MLSVITYLYRFRIKVNSLHLGCKQTLNKVQLIILLPMTKQTNDKCLKNLKRCKAVCCKTFAMAIPDDIKKNMTYYILRGCSFMKIKHKGKVIHCLLIPSVCKALKNNKCSLWNTKNMPNVCRRGPNKIKNLPINETCVYYEKKLH